MNLLPFDYIILLSIFVIILFSTIKGFVRQFFGFSGILGGLFVASQFYYIILSLHVLQINNTVIKKIIAFFIVFVAVFIISLIISRIIKKILKESGLGWLDHFIGSLIGLFYGIGILIILSIIFMRLPFLNINNFFFQSIITLKTIMMLHQLVFLIYV